jgi:hypothetical protein
MCRHSGPQGRVEPFTIVDDPSAWLVKDYQGREDAYIYTFTPEDIQELDAAIARVEQGGLRIEVQRTAATASSPSMLRP